jgi:hypothetical protein
VLGRELPVVGERPYEHGELGQARLRTRAEHRCARAPLADIEAAGDHLRVVRARPRRRNVRAMLGTLLREKLDQARYLVRAG